MNRPARFVDALAAWQPAALMVFDALHLDGARLMG